MLGWMEDWLVYIVDKNGQYYVGVTTNLKNRLRQHGNPRLLYTSRLMTRSAAVKFEKSIKGWSRAKKEEFIQTSSVSDLRE